MSEPFPEVRNSGRKCPLCGKPTVERFRPFCSGRCADLDLGRWLKGSYAIPAEEGEVPAQVNSGEGADEPAGEEVAT